MVIRKRVGEVGSGNLLHVIKSDDAETSLPVDHLAEMMLQMTVTAVNFTVHMCTGEAGVVYTYLLYCPDDTITAIRSFIETNEERLCGWEHEYRAIQSFPSDDDREILKSRLPIWKSVNNHIRNIGPVTP